MPLCHDYRAMRFLGSSFLGSTESRRSMSLTYVMPTRFYAFEVHLLLIALASHIKYHVQNFMFFLQVLNVLNFRQ